MNLELYTWWGLLQIFLILFVTYWAIKLLLFVMENIGQKSSVNRKINGFLKKILLLYKPLALALLLLNFISINYITHSFLLVFMGVFTYSHIRNYINGIIIKLNPLMAKGASVIIEETRGTLKSLRPFGATISTEIGERYMDYNTIEKLGFTIISNSENSLRQTLFITTDFTKDDLLDLLFGNPIIDYNKELDIALTEQDGIFRLQYTLEKGAKTEDLMAFFEGQKIKTSFKKV